MSNSCVVSWVLRRAGLYFKFTHPPPPKSADHVLARRIRSAQEGPRGQEVAPLESKEPTSCLLGVAFAR